MESFNYYEYINNYDDLRFFSQDRAWQHYVAYGKNEGRTFDTNNLESFSVEEYRRKDPKFRCKSEEWLILHYIRYGKFNVKNTINLIGQLGINCSTTEAVTLLKNYLEAEGHTVGIHDVNSITDEVYNAEHNIVCVQPFCCDPKILSKFANKPAALWFWEFKSLPPIYKTFEHFFSKVYTMSQFCVDVFTENLSIPVELVKARSQIHQYLDLIPFHEIENEDLNCTLAFTEGQTRFCYCFDLNSSIVRKGALNLVRAFSKMRNMALILKIRKMRINHRSPESHLVNELLGIVRKSPNIYLIDAELSTLDLYTLYSKIDCYISPHCGEGFGLTIYDNIVLGKAVISTYYSGEMDFLIPEGPKKNFIRLDHVEKQIPELSTNPNYRQMPDLTAAYVSVEEIIERVSEYYNEINPQSFDVSGLIHVNDEDTCKGLGVTCSSSLLNDDNVKNFSTYNGSDGLSIVLKLLTSIRKHVSNSNVRKMLNRSLASSNVNIIFDMPSNCRKLYDRNMVNIIYTMFESNRLPKSWVENISILDYCIVPSNEIKDMFIESGVMIPIHSIELPLEPFMGEEIVKSIEPKHQYWKNDREFIIGFIGNWKQRKNIDKLIMAVERMRNLNFNVKLKLHFAIWYGVEYKNEFLQLYTKCKSFICFSEGSLSIHEKYDFIKSVDLIVSCSSGEGFSYPPREAIAMKTPILITDVMGHKDIIDSGYCSTINTNKSDLIPGDYKEDDFCGKMVNIEMENIASAIIDCYNNYQKCIDLSTSAYYFFYEKFLHYSFENKFQSFMKKLLPMRKPKNKKVLLFSPFCFYPPTDGCHTVVLEQINDMLNKNYDIHVYACDISIGPFSWTNDSIEYFAKMGVKINVLKNEGGSLKHEILKGIMLHDFGIVRINYQPERCNLSKLFDHILINRDSKPFNEIVFVLDSLDDVKLSDILYSSACNSTESDFISRERIDKILTNYYKQLEQNDYKNIVSNYQNVFDIILSLNEHETFIFNKSVGYRTLILNHVYSIPENKMLAHTSRNKIVFAGGSNIFNIQGIEYFVRNVLPLLPDDFVIHLYGGICKVIRTDDKRLIKCGYADNLDESFTNALFSIAPIISGTGSKIKIFDSLMRKVPVVTFLNNRCEITYHGKNCFFVDSETEFAETCIRLKENPELCEIDEDFHQTNVLGRIKTIKDEFYDLLESNLS